MSSYDNKVTEETAELYITDSIWWKWKLVTCRLVKSLKIKTLIQQDFKKTTHVLKVRQMLKALLNWGQNLEEGKRCRF